MNNTLPDAYISDGVRTPIGRYGGALATIRANDLAAIPIATLLQRQQQLDAAAIDDVVLGCANQSGEDNRNVARMASLLAGLPESVPGVTVNRLCGSGLNAVSIASQMIKAGEANVIVAGGVESMSRAPFVLGKSTKAFERKPELYDTTLGWRFVNPKMRTMYGVDAMSETAENVAEDYGVSRADQDAFAVRSQQKAAVAWQDGRFQAEVCEVSVTQRQGDPSLVAVDEHLRPDTDNEKLAQLKPLVKPTGSVTAGNASGINDGSCAVLISSATGCEKHGLTPMARIVASASAGVSPRAMGAGPIDATRKVLAMTGLSIADMDIIELNEAFAVQALAVLRALDVPDDAEHVNRYGGAIALGHPLGMSGARLAATAAHQLQESGLRYALCTMCIGVGQGIAMIIERVAS